MTRAWALPALALLLAGCGDPAGGATPSGGGSTSAGSTGSGAPPMTECGDGIRQLGEECDDGADDDPDDGCTPACTVPTCGDGYVQPSLGEACDDGDDDDGDGCTAQCAPTEGRRWQVHASGEGASDDEVGGVTIDGAGNVIVIGTLWVEGAHTDIWIAKYDPAGTLLWEVTHDGPATSSRDRGRAVAVDAADNVFAVGAEVTGGGESRGIWIARLAPDGSETWSRVENGPGGSFDDPFAVAATPDGGALVGGFEGVPAWLGRYDAAGTQVWARTFEGDGGGGILSSLAVGPNEEIYASGNLDGLVWVARLDPAGAPIWSDTFDITPEAFDFASALALTDFGLVAAGGDNLSWLRAYDLDGKVQWSELLDERFDTSLPGVAQLSGGDLVAVGAAPPTDNGSQALLLRMTADRQVVWRAREPGAAGVSWARAVASGPGGTFAVAGLDSPALGETDVWVALYGP